MNRALIAVALVTAGCRSSGGTSFEEGRPVRQYAVSYRVKDGGRVSIERLVVNRPFESHLMLENAERITAIGRLATRSTGGPWTVLEIPPAAAGRDLRPDIATAVGRARGLIQRQGVKTVAGRRCRVYRAAGPVDTGTLTTDKPTSRRHTDFCVGRGVIVLEQIEVDDGEVTRHVQATAVKTGAAAGSVTAVPDGETVTADAGGGRTRPIDPSVRPGFERFYVLPDAPAGFGYAGRYAVVPLGLAGATSLVADVYTRGADYVQVDQGATISGPPPFDGGRPASTVNLGALGDADVVLDLRANEVRVLLPDDGFLRVAGTLATDDLVAIARQLRLQPKDAR